MIIMHLLHPMADAAEQSFLLWLDWWNSKSVWRSQKYPRQQPVWQIMIFAEAVSSDQSYTNPSTTTIEGSISIVLKF